MTFCNTNSFRALPTVKGVTHFAFGRCDATLFCDHNHSDCACARGGPGATEDLSSLRSALSGRCGELSKRRRQPLVVAAEVFDLVGNQRLPLGRDPQGNPSVGAKSA